MELYDRDMFGEEMRPRAASIVAQRFGFPPFSVLDTKTGEWQDRKRAWLALGIKSEIGRSAKAYNIVPSDYMDNGETLIDNGTSVFDPVISELVYRWFSPAGGMIVDPFAGGSVRGLVAGALGRYYWGCDLRAEQVAANDEQAREVPVPVQPMWVCGDSLLRLDIAPKADLIFSCPPYGDLEVYSDDPRDLSAMTWQNFEIVYGDIVDEAVKRLKDDRFAVFVVGDFRDPRGNYRNFVGLTVEAFLHAGCSLYNEAVLLTSVGSACMRVSKQFSNSRKFAKTHQNVLVFVKGDGKRAADACGLITEGI